DIRGRYPEELNMETVYELGRAFGTYYKQHGASKISVGHDCRESYPVLKDALVKGLLETGMDVTYLGMVPTPLLYFSIHEFKLDGAIMITGSHNPPEYNGFKVCLGKATIYGEEIQKLREIEEKGRFSKGEGSLVNKDVIKPYLDYLKKNIHPGKIKRRVIIDAGNGVGGLAAPQVYRAMGVDVETLFCEPDARFPNHHPDPTIPENLVHLKRLVNEKDADLGISFDGDADRIGVIDKEGNIIWGDQLMIIFSRAILKKNPGAVIIGGVKCSQVLYDDIKKQGGIPIMWKAGHSLIKSKMRETGALFAGEMSGHLFFADRYFGFDDAIYAGARLLEILTTEDKGVSDLLAGIPVMVNTPEIRLDCPDDKKFGVVKKLVEEFKQEYEVIDVDGARVLFDGGWGLVRSSNTQPVLVLRFEAADEKRLEEIRALFMEKLERVMQDQ
ncbi:MAG: phosphomannomutase/phosphoglucomutase, partial [Deltaproteobacteria bacterium]|nr:phosphomannomutase/phosphoglucomutase [Deltaproteobacteria bacterium]